MPTSEFAVLRPRLLSPGGLRVCATPRGVCRLELWRKVPPGVARRARSGGGEARAVLEQAVRELEAYFDGRPADFRVAVDLEGLGTPFQLRVWRLLRRIHHGETWTYGEVAARLGIRGGARAVGGAVGRNPVAIIIPCHRVVGSGGRLTGFSAGLSLKVKLLRLEGYRLTRAATTAARAVIGYRP